MYLSLAFQQYAQQQTTRVLRWLTLQDDELPTWAHTTLTMGLVSIFAVPLFRYGNPAIITHHMIWTRYRDQNWGTGGSSKSRSTAPPRRWPDGC
jgi:hypothetical protein